MNMRLIMHIGMGKTGSSALQAALAASSDALLRQDAQYLGMWFDMLSEGYRGLQNQFNFLNLPEQEMRGAAHQLRDYFRWQKDEGNGSTFIISNESFSGQSYALKPLIEELQADMHVQIVGYVRHPLKWLPSAYAQWGVRDKAYTGHIASFDEKGRELINWYRGLLDWADSMGELLDVRDYDAICDIVTDFGHCTGLEIEPLPERKLQRPEDAELLMRAYFNDRINEAVLPKVFDKAVAKDTHDIPNVAEMAERIFDYSSITEIIEEKKQLLSKYNDLFGINLLTSMPHQSEAAGVNDLSARLTDCLVSITLEQGRRIATLEDTVAKLQRNG